MIGHIYILRLKRFILISDSSTAHTVSTIVQIKCRTRKSVLHVNAVVCETASLKLSKQSRSSLVYGSVADRYSTVDSLPKINLKSIVSIAQNQAIQLQEINTIDSIVCQKE